MNKRRIQSFVLLFFLLLAAACGDPAAKKQKYFTRGQELFEQGDYVNAALEVKNAIQVDPKFAAAYALLGECELKQGEPRRAYGAFAKAVELDGALYDARISLGELLLLGRDPLKALEQAEAVLAARPDNQAALALKAGCLAETGQREAAEKILAALTAADTDQLEAWLRLARLRHGEKDLTGARALLERALEKQPDRRRVRLLLVNLLEEMNDVAAAEAELATVLEGVAAGDRERLILSRFYARHGRLEDAEQVLVRVRDANPDAADVRLILARFHAANGRAERFVAELEGARKALPKDFAICREWVGYLLSQQKVDEALVDLQAYREAVTEGPDNISARVLTAEITLRRGDAEAALVLADGVLKDNPGDLGAQLVRGEVLLAQKDLEGAVAAFRAVIDENPDRITLYLRLAQAHLANEEPNLAVNVLEDAVRRQPGAVNAVLALADVLRRQGNDSRVLSVLETGLQAEPDALPLLERVAVEYARRGRTDDGLRLARQRLEAHPDAPLLRVLEARMLLAADHRAEARLALDAALAADPGNQPATLLLARLEQIENRLPQALEKYLELHRKRPDDAGIAMVVAALHEKNGDYDLAGAIYRDLFKHYPDSPVTANNLAYYLAEHDPTPGNLATAQRIVTPLVQRFPNQVQVVDTAAWVYYRQGNHARAYELIRGIAAKLPDVPLALYHAGVISQAAGDDVGAKDYLLRALAAAGEGEFAERQETERLLEKVR
ncbi:MAG: tetratricopeptide repeat protein [Deltaproteobacteria bacterium]|nr:tetratricopeptide repeat protein [Candidatus Anaeroferrophillacea bacterium]